MMTEYSLDYFIDLKDKSKANNTLRNSFEMTWLNYVATNGFDIKAQESIIICFSLKRFNPLMKYLDTLEEDEPTLKTLLTSKKFMENRKNALKMTCDLLAKIINRAPDQIDTIVSLLNKFDALAHAKDSSEPCSDFVSIFQIYFVNELKANVVFPKWENLNYKPLMIESLKTYMQIGIISNNPKFTQKPCMKALKEWIKMDSENSNSNISINEKETSVETNTDIDTPVQIEQKTKTDNTIIEIKPESRNTQNPQNESNSSVTLDTVISTLMLFDEENNKKQKVLEDTLIQANLDKHRLEKALDAAKSERDMYKTSNAAKHERLLEMDEKLKKTSENLIRTEKELSETKDEIESLKTLFTINENNIDKTKDENLKRLSSELSSFYEDFMSVKDDEMSIELGDALRDQIIEIYTILKNHGLHFN